MCGFYFMATPEKTDIQAAATQAPLKPVAMQVGNDAADAAKLIDLIQHIPSITVSTEADAIAFLKDDGGY